MYHQSKTQDLFCPGSPVGMPQSHLAVRPGLLCPVCCSDWLLPAWGSGVLVEEELIQPAEPLFWFCFSALGAPCAWLGRESGLHRSEPWLLPRTFWLFACHFLWGGPVIMARQSFAAEMIHLTFSLLPSCSKEIQPWVCMSKNNTACG